MMRGTRNFFLFDYAFEIYWRLKFSLFGRKAIYQAVAAGLFQVLLTAAA
jgi:hypothetical protein